MAIAKAERLMNLALCLLGTRRPLSKRELRGSIEAYLEAGTDDSFNRMFERDKEDLRELGLVIETVENLDGETGYLARRDSNRLPAITLDAEEARPSDWRPRSGSRPGSRARRAAPSRSCAPPGCRRRRTRTRRTTARSNHGSRSMRPPSNR